MESEIVKVKASDYGIEESKAKEVEAVFAPMLQKMVELENEYNEILKKEISPETCFEAGTLRKKYVKVRTGTAEVHKQIKAFYLNGGRFIDGWKNAQLFVSQEKEQALEKIEKHFENLEKQRKEELKAKRAEMIAPYVEDVNTFMLGEMTEAAFDLLLKGAKDQYDLKIAAEKKAEEDRIEQQRKDNLHQERKDSILSLWNYLPDENKNSHFGNMDEGSWKTLYEVILNKKEVADKKQKEDEAERERLRKENEKKEKELAAEREKARKEQEAKDAEVAKAKAEAEAAKKETERLENERKAKEAKEAAERAEAERQAKAEAKKAERAPDKTKLLLLAGELDSFPLPELKSPEAEVIKENIRILISKTTAYIRTKAEEL